MSRSNKKLIQYGIILKQAAFYFLLLTLLVLPCVISYKFFILDRYFLIHNKELTISQLGTFGDFFGGTINPVLTYLTIIGIVITIFLQKRQLNESKSQYIHQQIESNLYNLIDIHNSIANELKLDFNEITNITDSPQFIPLIDLWGKTITGRAVFDAIYKLVTDVADESPCIAQTNRYRKLQDNNNHILGHYFRNLYQILKIINESSLSPDSKKTYTNIIRAQLSSSELAILLLNCLDDIVDDGAFRKLLIDYQFLEHIPLMLNTNNNVVVLGQKLPIVNIKALLQYIPDISKDFGAFGNNKFFTPTIKEILTKT